MTRCLDLFCCQGGAGMGYHLAGFEVVGVDLSPQPRYPFEFHQGDALEFLSQHGEEFDFIHASPPCQLYSKTHKLRRNDHTGLVGPVRDLLAALGKPCVIENVPGAPLRDPVELCGVMFGLRTYRHRLFEFNGFSLEVPEHPEHSARTAKMGRRVAEDEYMHVVGNFTGVDLGRSVMGMPWATRDGLREAIPPAYTEFIGRHVIEQLKKSE